MRTLASCEKMAAVLQQTPIRFRSPGIFQESAVPKLMDMVAPAAVKLQYVAW